MLEELKVGTRFIFKDCDYIVEEMGYDLSKKLPYVIVLNLISKNVFRILVNKDFIENINVIPEAIFESFISLAVKELKDHECILGQYNRLKHDNWKE